MGPSCGGPASSCPGELQPSAASTVRASWEVGVVTSLGPEALAGSAWLSGCTVLWGPVCEAPALGRTLVRPPHSPCLGSPATWVSPSSVETLEGGP